LVRDDRGENSEDLKLIGKSKMTIFEINQQLDEAYDAYENYLNED
jgi:hypothetical protein